jgi:glycosyltransferase involved in cell wall biosynthesis
MRGSVFVVVAAYNEADRISRTLAALELAFPGAPLWVADDGSTDGTVRIAAQAGARVIRNERVIGKGGAVTVAAQEALAFALASSGEQPYKEGELSVFLLCDGDLGESAGELGALVEVVASGEADLAVAAFARRLGGGFGLALAFARWAIRARCGLDATAPISGQRALSAAALHDVLPLAHGYGMEVGMTIDAVRAGHRLVEVELDLSHRTSGRTLAGFAHRARQLVDFVRAYLARR